MAQGSFSGTNFKIEGDEVQIFNYGLKIPEKGSKTFLMKAAGEVYAEVGMGQPTLPRIQDLFDADRKDGKLDKVKYVLVSPAQAGWLLAERTIKPEAFKEAQEGELFGEKLGKGGQLGKTILLPRVRLGDQTVGLLIHNGTGFATLDANGEIV